MWSHPKRLSKASFNIGKVSSERLNIGLLPSKLNKVACEAKTCRTNANTGMKMSQLKCRICDSSKQVKCTVVNGRKLCICEDCLLLISGIVKDNFPCSDKILPDECRSIANWHIQNSHTY